MPNTKIDPNISSAEMTAFWRSGYPQLSGDTLSTKLASNDGIAKAHAFERKLNYPLVSRKVSVRAGFFLNKTIELLHTTKYDACISFASGFSLLTYYIALGIWCDMPNITFIDTDFKHIITERNKRVEAISSLLNSNIIKCIQTTVLDLEEACRKKQSLRNLFPQCSAPIFLLEGIIYFLSPECIYWILDEISTYNHAAILIDYWPENGPNLSTCFEHALPTLVGFMPENIKSFLDKNIFHHIETICSKITDIPIHTYEHQFSALHKENPKLIDQNKFFPVRLLAAEK